MLRRLMHLESTGIGIASISALLFVFLGMLSPVRVGDGMEYYAMYLAWLETHKPWMDATSITAYSNLVTSGLIQGMLPANWLMSAFPALQLPTGADFNHFWFYSFLAAVVHGIFSGVGINLNPHQSFIGLHWLLFCIPLYLAAIHFGSKGVLTVVVMTAFSPVFWFLNKVHTEFFTYSLTLATVILVLSHRYVAGALLLSICATQNPSFALLSTLLLLLRFVRGGRNEYVFWELVGIVLTSILVLAHPVYYLCRYGVVTPQLLAGGADIGANLSMFYIWFIDPDVGLLPNWPFGLICIAMAGAILSRRGGMGVQGKLDSNWWFWVVAYLVVCLYTHSSTLNLNSGATPGVARYALWYICLFFPVVLISVQWLLRPKIINRVLMMFIGVVGLWSAVVNTPTKNESYSNPTYLSRVLQKYLPAVYDPPPEIFAERYSGVGESELLNTAFAVIGPDCKKILVLPGEGRTKVLSRKECGYDAVALRQELVGSMSAENSWLPYYFNMSSEQAFRLKEI